MHDIFTAPVKIHSQAAISRLGEETVILHLESGVYFGLDPIGTRIWEGLTEGQTGQEICLAISEEFKQPVSKVEKDVRAFLEDLEANGLLVA